MSTLPFVLGDAANVGTGWTLAIVPEGYTQGEAKDFDDDVQKFLTELLNTRPFNDADIRPMLNVVKFFTPSIDTGNAITLLTPALPTSPFNTAFGAMFGRDTSSLGKQIVRSLYGDNDLVRSFVKSQGFAAVNSFLVIVNNTKLDGGTAVEEVGWFSKESSDWPVVAIHELGHAMASLGDEYPYDELDDPVQTFNGTTANANQPNVTTTANFNQIKWGEMVTLPVPSTVPGPVRNHPLQPGVTPSAGPIGAFEGALHRDCGIFRPAFTCKMRDESEPFCQVCDVAIRANIGHYMLVQQGSSVAKAGDWTHMQTFFFGLTKRNRTLAYNATIGNYAISNSDAFFIGDPPRSDGTPPLDENNPLLGTGSIGGWNWLVPFMLGGTQHFFAYDFGSGNQAMFQMNTSGDTLIQTWNSAILDTWTHIVTLNIAGAPYYLSYDRSSGQARLLRIDSDATDPVFVNDVKLGTDFTALVSIPAAGGDPFVLGYRIATGEVIIQRINSKGLVLTFASKPGFWVTNKTHISFLDLGGQRSYVLVYSALDGRCSIHHIRTGGVGVDYVCTLDPNPGLGGPFVLGVGAPALGRFIDLPNSTKVFFYSALGRSIRSWTLQ